MVKKKKLLFLVLILIVPSFLISITYTPSNPTVGVTVNFRTDNFNYSSGPVTWNFGDGTTGTSTGNYGEITHVYKDPGTYTVTAQDSFIYINETTIITINDDRSITVSSSPYQAGKPLTITLINAKSPPIKWNFGDGISQTGSSTINHTYSSPGSYTIEAYDFNGTSTVPVSRTITVGNPKTITWTPLEPYEEQTVYFKANNFRGSILKWDFGDGTISNGPNNMQHKYNNYGVYTIKVYDYGGDDAYPAVSQITVKKDPRSIVVTNPTPGLTEPVIFQALNFFSENVLWDFGDGTQEVGGPIITHRFRKTGIFTVRAKDYAGNSQKVFETKITVVAKTSHSSSLVISGIELFFTNNNKNYLVIPTGVTNVKAKARIKYEGTGILNAYWAIDGQAYHVINRVLSFGQYVEFYLDKIPSLVTGYHTISIVFSSPQPAFETSPELGLFVSPVSKFVTLRTPYDKENFALGENINFIWKRYPLALKYAVVMGKDAQSVLKSEDIQRFFVNNPSYSPKINYKVGDKYYWMVEAYDIYDNVIAKSEVREFTIVKNLFPITEKEKNNLIALGGSEFILLNFEITSAKIKKEKYYLVRVFVNNLKANEFVEKGEKLKSMETSVKIKKGVENTVKIKIYEIFPDRLKLVSYKLIKL